MRYEKLIELIEEFTELEWFEDEDHSGVQVHCSREEIDRVLVCLELNDEVIAEAVAKQADMIITHHPLLFHPVNSITPDTPVGRYLLQLIASGIDVYSSHLAFDAAPRGNSIYLAELLRLRDVAVPEEWDEQVPDDGEESGGFRFGGRMDDAHCYARRASFFGDHIEVRDVINDEDTEFEYDMDEVGSIGYLPVPMDFREFCTYVERRLDLPKNYIRCVDGGRDKLEKIAFCTGAGGEFIYRAVREHCDAYITGDLKLHEAQYAKAMGLTVIDAGHYGTEKIFTENFAAQLREAVEEEGGQLAVMEAESVTNPYTL
ncbi:MAG: Nif3-like dinuclear metal center hexameric protein [Bacillota bacterium]|nr:Nif3-like dinuclear metal center hexameric protein [Bacillota bacterium]